MKIEPHKSSLGPNANIMALLCYVAAGVLSWIPVIGYVAWLAPLVIFFIEKDSIFVKFNAFQAFLLEVVVAVIQIIVAIITWVIWSSYAASYYYSYSSLGASLGIASVLSVILIIIEIAITVLAIVALFKAYNYTEFKIPLIGNLAEKMSNKGPKAE